VILILSVTTIDKYFSPLGIGRLFSNLIILTIILASIFLTIYSTEILSFIPSLFGKDLSFTGRDLIWAYIWIEIQKKFWLGYGYGSYWIMGTSVIDLFRATVGWRVNEAHNGFLEIILQTGIVGFTLFVSLIASFLHKIIKTGFIIALLVFVSIVIVNFSESFIFQPRSPSTLIFIFFYLLCVDKYLTIKVSNKQIF
jgi:O-antigen ligase